MLNTLRMGNSDHHFELGGTQTLRRNHRRHKDRTCDHYRFEAQKASFFSISDSYVRKQEQKRCRETEQDCHCSRKNLMPIPLIS